MDPNVIGSVLLGGITRERYVQLLDQLGVFEICYSTALITEILNFSKVPYFISKGITEVAMKEFIADFCKYSLKIMVTSEVKQGRDENDYYLLSLCRDARAKLLTTGDPDLLTIGQYSSTKIISFKDFTESFV